MAVSMDSESAAPLLGEDSHTRPARPRRQSWTHQVRVWLPLSVLMLFASLALSVVWLRIPSVAGFLDKNRLDDSLEPSRASLRYVVIQPEPDAWTNTLYTGEPFHESDVAWSYLQTVRLLSLDKAEGSRLNMSGLMANKDHPASIMGVMHNIHCIRIVRQVLHPEYYYPGSTLEEHKKRLKHVAHCLEALRQSVMCTPDLTPLPVRWEDEEREAIALNPSSRQRCVDWNSLVEWERQRKSTIEDLWRSNPVEVSDSQIQG